MFKPIKKAFATIISMFFVMSFSNTITHANGTAKILVIGNFSCGKTQMCRVMCGIPYNESAPASTSEVCATFNMSETATTVKLWDTLALDLDYQRAMELAREAHVVFVLHDTEKPITTESFKYIGKLYSDLTSRISPGCKIVSVCTKADTKAQDIPKFIKNYRQLKDIFESLECNTIFVISSKTGEGFDKIKEYLKITLSKMVLPIAIEEQLPVRDIGLFERIEKLRKLKEEVQTEESGSASEKIDKTWYKTWKNLKF